MKSISTRFMVVFVFVVLIAAPSWAANGSRVHRHGGAVTVAPADTQPGAAPVDNTWPTVASEQRRQIVPQNCDGAICQPDVGDPTSTGGTDWGLCKTNSSCSLQLGQCYSRAFGTCQVRLKGSGDACQAC